MLRLGINRNILECKDIYFQKTNFSEKRINRNILECKGVCGAVKIVWITVLIETYWNVKGAGRSSDLTASPGINRNILECKGATGSWYSCGSGVLIETYWNVKVLSAGGSGAQTGY